MITDLGNSLGRYLAVKKLPPASGSTAVSAVASERRLYDTRDRTWSVAANYAVQRPSPLDSTGTFYYLQYKQLVGVETPCQVPRRLRGDTSVSGGRGASYTVNATFDGHAGRWLLAYDPAGTVTALETTSLATRTYAVKFLPTKVRVKTVACAPPRARSSVGSGVPSLAQLHAGLNPVAQYPKVPYAAGVIGEVEGSVHATSGRTSTSAPTPTPGSSAMTRPSRGSTGRTRRRSPRSAPRARTGPGPRLGNSREPDLLRDGPEVRRARRSPRDHRPRRGTAPRRQLPGLRPERRVTRRGRECRVRRNLSLGRARSHSDSDHREGVCLRRRLEPQVVGGGPRPGGRGLRRRGLGTRRNRLGCQRDHPRRALRRHRGGVAPG